MAFFIEGQVIMQLTDFIGQLSFSCFLLVEAETVEAEAVAIGVQAEAVDEIAASTSLFTMIFKFALTRWVDNVSTLPKLHARS